MNPSLIRQTVSWPDAEARCGFHRGLSPAISIDQKTTSHNPRSTVGTVTEIYDYLRLLYARVGHVHCHKCGRPISQQTVEQMVDQILSLPEGTRLLVLAPMVRGRKGEFKKLLEEIRREGYVRVRLDGELYELSDVPPIDKQKSTPWKWLCTGWLPGPRPRGALQTPLRRP